MPGPKCSDFLQPIQLTHIYLQKLNPVEVAVSKLCCPVCWDYIDILSEKREERGGPGQECTTFAVAIPPSILCNCPTGAALMLFKS